jgi:hypothetical protein
MTARSAPTTWAGAVSVVVIVAVAAWLAVYLPLAFRGWTGAHIGWDFAHYLAGARAFLETGSPYAPETVAGRYAFDDMAFVHPPVALVLLVPFLALPAGLWWAVPIGLTAWCIARWRPSLVGWAVMAVLLAMPLSVEAFFLGNSSLWMMAGVALGLRFGWPFALLALKPTFLPLALLGARRRETWAGLAIVGLLALPFGALWLEWVTVLRNFDGPTVYTLFQLPLILVPVVAYVSRNSASSTMIRPTSTS